MLYGNEKKKRRGTAWVSWPIFVVKGKWGPGCARLYAYLQKGRDMHDLVFKKSGGTRHALTRLRESIR